MSNVFRTELTFLGFVINSKSMKISLAKEKSWNIIHDCREVLDSMVIKIRCAARVIGKLIATFPAVKYGPLHFRFLESCKSKAVKLNKGNYEALISFDDRAIENLIWWTQNILSAQNDIF